MSVYRYVCRQCGQVSTRNDKSAKDHTCMRCGKGLSKTDLVDVEKIPTQLAA